MALTVQRFTHDGATVPLFRCERQNVSDASVAAAVIDAAQPEAPDVPVPAAATDASPSPPPRDIALRVPPISHFVAPPLRSHVPIVPVHPVVHPIVHPPVARTHPTSYHPPVRATHASQHHPAATHHPPHNTHAPPHRRRTTHPH
jgi:hypothetical protein